MIRLVGCVVLVLGSWTYCGAQSRTSVDPELIYYADAYADHFHVPRALFHAVIGQESDWQPRAVSNKGAMGLTQLMPGTAKAYMVSNPFAATDNLSGGARYLADLLAEFHGEMRMAVAAYYCGPRHIARQGLQYRNPDVVAYVESVRRRYMRELREQTKDDIPISGGRH